MLHLARRVPWLITRRLGRFDAPLLQYTSGCIDSGECLKNRADPLDSLLVLTDYVKKEVRRLDTFTSPNGTSNLVSPNGMRQVADILGRSEQAMICISERDENERIRLALDSQPNSFQPFSTDRDILYFIMRVTGNISRNIFINPAGQFDNVPRLNDGIPVVKEVMIHPRDLDLPLGSVVSLFISNSFIIAVEDQTEEPMLAARPLYVNDALDSDNTIFDQNTWFIKDRAEGRADFFFTSVAPNLQNICIVGGSENVPLELVNSDDDPEICRPNLQQTIIGRLDRCRPF